MADVTGDVQEVVNGAVDGVQQLASTAVDTGQEAVQLVLGGLRAVLEQLGNVVDAVSDTVGGND